MSKLKLFLFGPPRLEREGQLITIKRRKTLALLIYLAVTQQPHSRDALATLFWPDSDQRTGRGNLRRTLYRLNQAVGEDVLSVTPETMSLNPQADLWLDIEIFQQYVVTCFPTDQPPGELSPECLSYLTEAAKLYTDDFLAGFTLSDSPDFDDWQFFQTESLRQSLSQVLERLVYAYQARAEFEPAISYARRWLALDSLHEPAHRHLMQLYAWSGQQAAALRQYRECERIFEEELDVSPAEETLTLYEAIKAKRLPTPVEAGEQRSRSAEEESLPHPSTLAPFQASSSALKHNLPPQPTPFIGRAAELAALGQLLAKPNIRLITITGAGGMGKTRLALAIAEQELSQLQETSQTLSSALRFPDGIFFVTLAPLKTTDRIIPTLAEALSFQLASDSLHARSPRQQILDYLQNKRMLLIMDNFEHLLEGLDVVIDILRTAPGVRILTTSREQLNLHEEHVFLIQGLDYPEEPDALSSLVTEETTEGVVTHGAVQLFLQNAQRVQPDFALNASEWPHLTRICRLVDGMPLAVELAASWVDMLSLADIAAEIQGGLDFLEVEVRNIPQRHRNIRAVFDASWQRLDAHERNIFAQLSIFRGGFTRTAAQEVTGASLRMLAKLANKSLLQYDRGRDRYLIHELLRQYGAEKLVIALDQEATVWNRYSAYFCAALSQIETELRGSQQQEALAHMLADQGNILAAWHWAASQGLIELLAQAMDSLGLFHEWQARFREGEILFQTTVQFLQQTVPSARSDPLAIIVLVKALTWQSVFARLSGNNSQAEQLAQRSLQFLENSDLAEENEAVGTTRAVILLQLGHLALNIDNIAAQQWYEQSLALYRILGAEWEKAHVLAALSELYQAIGQYDEAIRLAEESLAIQRALGDQRGVARSLAHLSLCARHTGESEAAVRFARDSYSVYQALGYRANIADGLHNLGMTLTYVGEFAEALAALEKSIALYDELGNRLNIPIACARAAIIDMSLGQYDQARHYAERAVSLGREVNDQSAVGLALTFIGWLHLVAESYDQALEKLQEGLSIFESIGRQAEMGMTLALLGGAYRGLGERPKAQQLLRQALQSAYDHRNFLPLTAGLHLVALMLMEQAETLPKEARDPCQRQALSLYALGQRYPPIGKACEVDDIAGRYLRPLMEALPPEFIEEAMAQGQKLDLWPTIADLLGALPGLGWGSDS